MRRSFPSKFGGQSLWMRAATKINGENALLTEVVQRERGECRRRTTAAVGNQAEVAHIAGVERFAACHQQEGTAPITGRPRFPRASHIRVDGWRRMKRSRSHPRGSVSPATEITRNKDDVSADMPPIEYHPLEWSRRQSSRSRALTERRKWREYKHRPLPAFDRACER